MTHVIIIRGALLIDGKGTQPRRLDVAVQGGRITEVEPHVADVGGAVILDVDGLVLAPGFIDIHSHADLTLPVYPDATNSIAQGVTTEIVGNCGFSPAPVPIDPSRAELLRELVRGLGPDLDWRWRTWAQYLDRLEAARPAVNVAALVGHAALRIGAMGMEDRPGTPQELAAMRASLTRALADGAWGMSTGLVYPPGVFADTGEIVAVGQALRSIDALYASHIRDETAGLLAAIDEALGIATALGVRLQVSHLKAAGQPGPDRIRAAIDRIATGRASGIDATCDAYPYTWGSTYLAQVLPPWVQAGGTDALVGRLGDGPLRQRIRHELANGSPGWSNLLVAAGGWDGVLVASSGAEATRWAEGRTIEQLAAERAADPFDLALGLLIAGRGATTMLIRLIDEQDMRSVLRAPFTAIGSDQLGVTGPGARVHPRSYGSFARVLGSLVRDEGLLPLEEAIRRMTSLPASIVGLGDRGVIAPCMVADLVVFDPLTIADRATVAEPTRPPSGVEHVLINGRFAVRDRVISDASLGRVLRRPPS